MQKTPISWADNTMSPWYGCTKDNTECAGCFAEHLMDKRFGRVSWGKGKPRQRTKDYSTKIRQLHRRLGKQGKKETVFPSLCDPFDEEVPNEWRSEFYVVAEECTNIRHLLLTKRPQNVLEFVPSHWLGGNWPQHIRIGISIGREKTMLEKLPYLWEWPDDVPNFISLEPWIGEIQGFDLLNYEGKLAREILSAKDSIPVNYQWILDKFVPQFQSKVHCIVVGGESSQGSFKARPLDLIWASNLKAYLNSLDGPKPKWHFKQTGSNPVLNGEPFELHGHKGDDAVYLHNTYQQKFPPGFFDQELPDWNDELTLL